MKIYIRFLISLLFMTVFWQCYFRGGEEAPPTGEPKETITAQKGLEADLSLVNYLVFKADSFQAIGEMEHMGRCYQEALSRLDSLAYIYETDSLFLTIYQQISDKYQDYIESLDDTSQDLLSADQVLQELNSVYGSEKDSSLFIAPESAESLATNHIPIIRNRKVEKAITYFTRGRGRRVFTRWLQRTGRYEKLIKSILREEGAPEELFYLAMIESGLNPAARSYARAVGMWQFISATGKAYGLHHSWWYDERRDPIKATRAAARHLLDLYERFGDWYLAIAGYNFNPRKIERRMSRYNVDEFWELPRLPRQTRNYVPTFLAAVTIARDPEQYGFQPSTEPPLEFDTVTVRECVDLNVVADCVGSTFAELKKLNPALLRWCTPPDRDKWLLYLPKGTRETFLKRYAEIPADKKRSWIRHRIRAGETLSTIARKYGVSMREIKRFNKIRGSLIRAGHSLLIPVPQDRNSYRRYVASQHKRTARKRRKPVDHVPGRVKEVYIVKRGDTLWEVAQKFGVTVS
ncbi:MAG: LysM peptidoglycan-binding domain-containing protein, partial [Calditrichaeota bacterium]